MEGNNRTIIIIIFVVVLGIGAFAYYRQNNETNDSLLENGVDVVYQTDAHELPDWVPGNVQANPWTGSIYLAWSSDGLTFTEERFFIQHAGVPHLLLTDDNKIVATFQYFSYTEESMFDRIAYTVSEDFGETWSPVKLIQLGERYRNGPTPVDPTLVQLEDGKYRLYYTFHEPGNTYAGLYSSSSVSLDDVFLDEGVQLLTECMLLDPAVVYYDGLWHHYTVNHGGTDTIHSVSETGLGFTLQPNIEKDYQFLGDAIVDEGKLRFYGTGNGVILAESDDGYVFQKIKDHVADGADPGVIKLPDGSYMIVYSK